MPALVDEITDPSQTGKYQGMVNMSMSVGRAVGPLYGGLVIDHAGYPVLFLSVTVLMVVSLGLMSWRARKEQQ